MSTTINEDLKRFVREYVNSIVTWAIIVFYHQNPGVHDRVSDLARHLGRRDEDVEKAAEYLAKRGFLQKDDSEVEAVYSYNPDTKLREQSDAFVNALDVRDVRLWILSEVLDK